MKKGLKLLSVSSSLCVLCTLCVVGVMVFGVAGCSRSDYSGSGREAAVSFRVSPIVDLQGGGGFAGSSSDHVADHVADRLPELTDFAVRVVNPAGEVLRSWASADEVPETLSLDDGSFKLVAEYTGGQVLPNRGTPYYYGETRFKVAGGVVSSSSQSAGGDADARSGAGAGVAEIVVEPAMAAVRVSVEFDGSFGDEYSVYSVDIKTVGDEFVTFVGAGDSGSGADGLAGGAGSGYLAPGGMKLRFHVVKHGESEVVTYTSRDVIVAAAREHHTLRLKVNITGGKPGFSFTTDESTNDVVVDVDNVPNWVMPKAAPSAVLNGFVTGGAVITTEGQGRNASVAFRAVGGLTSMVLRTNGNGFINGELPAEVDLVTADEAVKQQLRDAGLVWSEDKVYAGSRDVVYVDFSGVIRRLYAVAVDGGGIVTSVHNFDMDVVDKYDQHNEACDLRVQVEPPVYGIVDLTDGVLFARRAYFDLSYENEVGMVPFMEYREVGGGDQEWRRVDVPDGGDRALFSASGASGVSGAVGRVGRIGEVGNVTYCITGLRAETKYEFRSGIASLGYAAGHVSGDVFGYTSESELQVPNAGMEDWDSYWAVEAILVSYDIPYFDANAKGGAKWWATNNDRTTAYRSSSFSYGYNSFPAVSMTRDKRSGNFAAEIRTTSASDIDALNATNTSQTHSQVPGMLYSGTFAYNKPNDDIREGRPFGARPSKVRFWYKFEEYNGESWEARVEVRAEGGVVVGRGVLTGKANVGAYTMGEVDVLYSGVRRRATDIVISFRSSAVDYPAVRPAVRKVTRDIVIPMKESYGKNWGIFVGTVLKVDDVELVYE